MSQADVKIGRVTIGSFVKMCYSVHGLYCQYDFKKQNLLCHAFISFISDKINIISEVNVIIITRNFFKQLSCE